MSDSIRPSATHVSVVLSFRTGVHTDIERWADGMDMDVATFCHTEIMRIYNESIAPKLRRAERREEMEAERKARKGALAERTAAREIRNAQRELEVNRAILWDWATGYRYPKIVAEDPQARNGWGVQWPLAVALASDETETTAEQVDVDQVTPLQGRLIATRLVVNKRFYKGWLQKWKVPFDNYGLLDYKSDAEIEPDGLWERFRLWYCPMVISVYGKEIVIKRSIGSDDLKVLGRDGAWRSSMDWKGRRLLDLVTGCGDVPDETAQRYHDSFVAGEPSWCWNAPMLRWPAGDEG